MISGIGAAVAHASPFFVADAAALTSHSGLEQVAQGAHELVVLLRGAGRSPERAGAAEGGAGADETPRSARPYTTSASSASPGRSVHTKFAWESATRSPRPRRASSS